MHIDDDIQISLKSVIQVIGQKMGLWDSSVGLYICGCVLFALMSLRQIKITYSKNVMPI